MVSFVNGDTLLVQSISMDIPMGRGIYQYQFQNCGASSGPGMRGTDIDEQFLEETCEGCLGIP